MIKLSEKEKIKAVYYGSPDPTCGITDLAKQYALYLDEIYIVDSRSLLNTYKKQLQSVPYYDELVERCKTVTSNLKQFSHDTGFSIKFYQPIEISDKPLWEKITHLTRLDIKQKPLADIASRKYPDAKIRNGMLAGVNIAYMNSCKLNAFPITQENNLYNLGIQKMIIAMRKARRKATKKNVENQMKLSDFHLQNLYGFKILQNLPIPVASLNKSKISELRNSKMLEHFREGLRKQAIWSVDEAKMLLSMEKNALQEARKIQKQMKSYQKVISNQIPQMKRKMIKDIGRDLIYTPLALLSGLVIGIPMAIVVCIVYLGSLPTWEYWSYHIEEKDLLSQYSPCCAFLINLPKTKAKPKLPLPSSKSILTNEDLKNLEEEEYGSLACAAMLNLWDFMR